MKKIKLTEAKNYVIPVPDFRQPPEINSWVVQLKGLWDNEFLFLTTEYLEHDGWFDFSKELEKAYRFSSRQAALENLKDVKSGDFDDSWEWVDENTLSCYEWELTVKPLYLKVTAVLELGE